MGQWADCTNIKYVFRHCLSEPELFYKGHYFDYAPIEKALWDMYINKMGFKLSDGRNPLIFPKFRQFLKDNAENYLDNLLCGRYTNVSI